MGAAVSGFRVEVSNTLWKGTQHCGFLPRRTCQDSKPQTTYISRQTQKGNSLIPSKADKNKQRPYIMEYKKWIDFISNKNTKHVSYVVHLQYFASICHPAIQATYWLHHPSPTARSQCIAMLRCALEEYPANCDAVEKQGKQKGRKREFTARKHERALAFANWHLLSQVGASSWLPICGT